MSQVGPLHLPRTRNEPFGACPPSHSRAEMVEGFRRAWFEGRLNFLLSENARGWDRLLEDIFGH